MRCREHDPANLMRAIMPTATALRASPSLPIIDVSGLSGGASSPQAVARELHQACTDTGFFYIANHGVPGGLIAEVLAQSRTFFALPPDRKLALNAEASPCRHGYEPLQVQTLEPGTPPDLKEGFLMGLDLDPDDPAVLGDPGNHGPNQWPDGLPRFRDTMLAYLEEALALSRRLMRGLALGLDLAEDHFDDFGTTPVSTLRLLHYPPQPLNSAPGEKGCGAHTDWGAITILLQDAAGGLEVRGPGGGFIPAPPIADTFVVNIGDLFARWTNNRYRSTVHRVINTSGRDRYSVPFFFDGRSDYVVSCLPGCCAPGAAPKFAETTVRGHLDEMTRRTYAGA
jgi:isopenicillin N synthase-like dioxygenase